MNKLGVNYNVATQMTPAEAFALFASLGFDAVFTGYFGSTAAMEPFAAEAARNGLLYESFHAPFGHINDIWLPGDGGDQMQKELTDCITSAGALAVPIVVIHLSSGEHPPYDFDLGHKRWDVVVDCAVRCGVTVAFENQRKLANLAYAMELYADVPQVGFCWDVGHEKCFANGMEYMPLFGKRLVYTHIHDNFRVHGGDLHMIPFDGGIDYSVTASHLKKAGYTGTLTLELLPKKSPAYADVPNEVFYQRAYDAAVRLRGML